LPDITIRPARAGDDEAVARLLYETAAGRYDIYGGGRRRAIALLEAALKRRGNFASRETVLVADVGGRVAGALGGFPVAEGRARARRFMLIAVRRTPPWRWPKLLWVHWAGERATPPAPNGSFYIDAVATDAGFRRRGVATAMLGAAAERARAAGQRALALDTAATNTGAQVVYERAGFRVAKRQEAQGPIPAIVAYVRDVE
jgi:ribosomal protein S18 acetylase RimI-like enzyme